MTTPGRDPLHCPGAPDLHWTTDNVGEAAPGVLTPLTWSFWGPVGDRHAREVAYRAGILSRRERRREPPDDHRIVRIYYGRFAVQVEYFALFGDRLPGMSGADAVRNALGEVPEGMTFHPTKRRYAAIAVRLPLAFLMVPRRLRTTARDTDTWWRSRIDAMVDFGKDAAISTLRESERRFEQTLTIHSLGLMSVVQPLYDAVLKLVEKAGTGDVATLSGTGGAEMAIIGDMWKASRGELEIEEVLRRHGFHGELEGELSSRVWRENPRPVRALIDRYAARDDSYDPVHKEQSAGSELARCTQDVLSALPRAHRMAARLLLPLAARLLPMRGTGKRSFLQSLDVARAAARRLGEILVAEGALDDPDDAFYLTLDELTGPLPADAKALVQFRRQRRTEYRNSTMPASWTGAAPELSGVDVDPAATRRETLSGVGVSAGVVEGTARVLHEPGFDEVEPDEILVAPTTDPSWASIMFLSSALVVDIGGALSHAAVVARELGIPCVVNTRSGTREIRTGDRVRVDGHRGTVDILPLAVSGEETR